MAIATTLHFGFSKENFSFHIGAMDLALVSYPENYPAGLPSKIKRYRTSRKPFVMSRSLLLGSSERAPFQDRQELGIIWNEDNDISNRFDVPYSPPMNLQETAPRYPLAKMLTRMLNKTVMLAVSYILPPSRRSLIRIKPRKQHTLWDQAQFVIFILCLVVLLHSLSGLGYAYHKCDTCLQAEAEVAPGRDLGMENISADVVSHHVLGAVYSVNAGTHMDENDITGGATRVNSASSRNQEPLTAKKYKIEDRKPFIDPGLLDGIINQLR